MLGDNFAGFVLLFVFILLMFVPGLRWGNVIDHFLNDHLLNVDIKAHETDKTESLQKFLIFLICILESGAGETVILEDS